MSASGCSFNLSSREIHHNNNVFIESSSSFNFCEYDREEKKVHVVFGGVEENKNRNLLVQYISQKFVIEYISSGKGEVFFRDTALPVMAGDMYVCTPQSRYRVTCGGGVPLRRLFLAFSGWQVWDLLLHSQIRPGRVLRASSPAAMKALFEEALSCGIMGGEANGLLCTKLLERILIHAVDDHEAVPLRASPAYATYRECKAHIERHFLRLCTLERWASECRIPAPRLCHIFRVYDTETPYQYLTRLKMHYARTLLRTSDVLVKQVAAEVGYKDPFHFSRVFRNYFGIPPEKSRDNAISRYDGMSISDMSARM